jgi:hypothetical protein
LEIITAVLWRVTPWFGKGGILGKVDTSLIATRWRVEIWSHGKRKGVPDRFCGSAEEAAVIADIVLADGDTPVIVGPAAASDDDRQQGRYWLV